MGDRVEDGPGPVLVATKLRPPTVRDQVVPRERLLERLRTGSGLALSLVACPAGYGKTTLLAAWREAEAAQKPIAWLTLDEDDNDPVVLWSYVIEALHRGESRHRVLSRPRDPDRAAEGLRAVSAAGHQVSR
jgi:LuxR family transcriptional regulator, maltose regulon positive regulatory protein